MGDNGLRILIAGIALMSCCSGLLGVLLGWKMRDREVRELKRRVRYYRGQLQKVGEVGEVGEERTQCGAVHPQGGKLICTRPRGHYRPTTSPHGYAGVLPHGYAGVFWEETDGKAG
jgi:hypothetical protein